MLKNPLKRHSRYMTFDAIAGYVDHSTVSTREIYAFSTTLSILRQYTQKALCIKTPLSRGETGKTFTDTENKKNNNNLPIFRLVCHRQPSNKSCQCSRPGRLHVFTCDLQIDQFRYIKIQSKTKGIISRLWGINSYKTLCLCLCGNVFNLFENPF